MKLEIGQKTKFQYLKQPVMDDMNSQLIDQVETSEVYFGEVVNVRDIVEDPVSVQTIRQGKIKGRRSRTLYTVELPDGTIKCFYDGRMVLMPMAKRGIFQRIISLFRRK